MGNSLLRSQPEDEMDVIEPIGRIAPREESPPFSSPARMHPAGQMSIAGPTFNPANLCSELSETRSGSHYCLHTE
jgi:hypothetical protein